MRFTVSHEQIKFFQLQGYVEVEDLLTVEEGAQLISAIAAVRNNSPGYPDENFYRSLPLVISLAKKKGWGQVAAELLHKKPLRLASDRFFSELPASFDPIEDHACGLFIDLKTGQGFFFKQFPKPKNLYNSSKNCYLLLILTAKHLPDETNPIVIK